MVNKIVNARNYTKVRVLLYLSARLRDTQAEELGPLPGSWAWRAPATIAYDTGVNEASLYVLLKRWREAAWGYVEARYFTELQMADRRPHWLYRINAKGQSYLNRLHKWYGAEAEVRAELEAYQLAQGPDFTQGKLAPRCIGWHIKPSKWAAIIEYPFESKADARYAVWYMHGFKVGNIDEAIYVANLAYKLKPSEECLTQAKAWQAHWLREAQKEFVAAGATG